MSAPIRAFTRPELLAVIAGVSLFALIVLPAVGNDRSNGYSTVCLSNMRHLANAWQLYAGDNNEVFAENYHGGEAARGQAASRSGAAPWGLGWLAWNLSPDNTNIALIRERKFARISPYFETERNIHKCPADNYHSSVQKAQGMRRVRSVALNGPIGGGNFMVGPADPSFVQVRSLTGLTGIQATPGEIYTFVEEHPDSINDPLIFPPNGQSWVDFPGSFHDGAASLAFIDGHAEIHAWHGSARNVPVRFSGSPAGPAGDPDLLWMRRHSTLRVGVPQ